MAQTSAAPKPRTETRTCTTCGQRADGPTTPVDPRNRAAGRVALLHDACYRQLLLDTVREWRDGQ